jgi:hypothetical protein
MNDMERVDTIMLMISRVRENLKDIEYLLGEMGEVDVPANGRCRILEGAKFMQDHGFWQAGGDICGVVFDAESVGVEPVTSLRLTADGYGRIHPEGEYGDGAIYIDRKYVEYVN